MKRPNKRGTIGAIATGIALFAGSAIVSGASAGDGTMLVPTVPSRILDTRLAGSSILTLGDDAEATISFANAVPAGARAVEINVTTTGGTAPSYLAVYPTGAQRPITSAVNWNGPTSQANSIAVKLSDTYEVDIYNAFGSVDVVIDMMGFYVDAPSGSSGSGQAGPAGPAGATGATGPQGIPGPAGSKGDNGAPGANGEDGIDGADRATGPAGADGAAGPAGPAGADGADGSDGPSAVSGHEVVSNELTSNGNTLTQTATCPTGMKVLGGGASTNNNNLHVVGSAPSGALNDTAWTATANRVAQSGGTQYSLTVYAICANV